MSIFFTKKDKIKSYHLYSFIFPLFFIFPILFSYVFLPIKNSSSQNIYSGKAISIDDEIKGIENAEKIKDNKTFDSEIENKEEIGSKSVVKVLMFGYHQIREIRKTDGPKTKAFITTPEIFEKEMKYLYDKGYHTISTTDYINYIKTGKSDFDLNRSVILTFDDGYASQYTNAFPILKKYGFTATFFIYFDCIDKYPACMTSLQIKDLANNNMKIGNHTLHHIFLPKYSDDNIKKEIFVNKEKIINLVGTSSIENIFAYPYGGTDERVENIVKNFEYDGAVGVTASIKKQDKNLFNLKRYLLGEDYDFFQNLFINK